MRGGFLWRRTKRDFPAKQKRETKPLRRRFRFEHFFRVQFRTDGDVVEMYDIYICCVKLLPMRVIRCSYSRYAIEYLTYLMFIPKK